MTQNKFHSQRFRDLVSESKRLNSEFAFTSTKLKKNHKFLYSPHKFQQTKEPKIESLKCVSSQNSQKIKTQKASSFDLQLKLKNLDSLERLSTDESSDKSRKSQPGLINSYSQNIFGVTNQPNIQKVQQSQDIIKNYQRSLESYDRQLRLFSLLKNSNQSSLRPSISQVQSLNNGQNFHRKNMGVKKLKELHQKNIGVNFKGQGQLLKWIRSNVIGINTSYVSPINLFVETVYADHTATNRPFKAVEVLVDHAKLFAANPHTHFSQFGKFSTELMHYARDSLLESFSAPHNKFVVLPTGKGSTGALEKAVHFLKILEKTNELWKNPKVYMTPYQHHSNILPWVEFYDLIQVLAHNQIGTLDLQKIYQQILNSDSQSIIITVSGASNVTSKITHLQQLNQTIKKLRLALPNKRIVFSVDCAAFCPHHELNLTIYDQIDFAFISPHKNLGGVESCGLLVARKSLIQNTKPTFPGGGTVRFVKGYSRNDVMYETDIFDREIAGTPPYFGFYRAALSFQLLKDTIGYQFIHKREVQNTKLFYKIIEQGNKKMKQKGIDMFINIYGQKDLNERANIATFNLEYGNFQFVQHSFASQILTDVFGIQIRSGCFCAGPYGIKLLDIKQEIIDAIQQQVQVGIMINKPGYLRVDLAFYLEDYEIEYIAKSVIILARYWKNFLKLYTVCNNGDVILLDVFSQIKQKQIYSLKQIEQAYHKVNQQNQDHENKLKERKKTLQQQLRLGKQISRNPVEYLKKIKSDFTCCQPNE